MSVTSARDADELWRIMNEPDIDPRLAEGLRSNQDFARWWVHQFLPGVELDELIEIKPNFTRERESWPAQSNSGRETDLHVVVKDRIGNRYAILTESKIVAPAGYRQPEDYTAYAGWGERAGKWINSVTVLMAPAGYLAQHRSADCYEATVSYELVCDAARKQGLDDLAAYLTAGIIRFERAGVVPRNPDDLIGAFRVQYADLLREENRELYSCMRGRDRKLFDSSRRWFDFCPKQPLLGRNGVRIIHQICNRKKGAQDRSRPQVVSVQVPRTNDGHNGPPNWGTPDQWRSSAKYWIRDVPIESEARLYFSGFDGDAARRVWGQVTELIEDGSILRESEPTQ